MNMYLLYMLVVIFLALKMSEFPSDINHIPGHIPQQENGYDLLVFNPDLPMGSPGIPHLSVKLSVALIC